MGVHLRKVRGANRTKIGRRKLRLFGCACYNLLRPLFVNEAASNAFVDAVEQHIDGRVSDQQIAELERSLPSATDKGLRMYAAVTAGMLTDSNAYLAGFGAASLLSQAVYYGSGREGRIKGQANRLQQTHLLRCIFGNPFRLVAFAPAWRTSDAVALARGIHDDHAFDRMPILADALQDAGCTDEAVLNHCRDTKTSHARGCWVVDHVLGFS